MKILVAPDSFKGSITAERFCRVITHAAKRALTDFEITSMPLSDGGEGFASILTKALKGKLEKIKVEGPLGKPTTVKIGFVDGRKTAIIESAQAIGMSQAGKRATPLKTSSYGVGEMISHAVDNGAEKIVLSLGGSSTNDLGLGMLSAMGMSFIDICGNRFVPVGGTLSRVEKIEYRQTFSKYREIEFVLMCDVKNPLLGKNGCAEVFAPQKGAGEIDVLRLESGAKKLVGVVKSACGTDESQTPGAGAAGGIGYGAMSFLNTKTVFGVDAIMDIYRFKKAVAENDIIITGEGKFDAQSFMGKVFSGILSERGDLPVVVFCGSYEKVDLPENVTVIPIGEGYDLEYSMNNAADLLLTKAEYYFRNMQ